MNNCRAKVADFGFAKLAPTDASHISTQVKGTAGYLDPEYLRTYQLNEKSDVYSFGVLLVELVTGRRPIEPKRSIIERVTTKWVSFCHSRHHTYFIICITVGSHYCSKCQNKDSLYLVLTCFIHAFLQAMEKFVEGNAIQTLDPNLEATDAINLAVEKLYELALQCLAPTKRSRPSMKRCTEILWSIRKDYRELVAPTSAMNWSRWSVAINFQFASLESLQRLVVEITPIAGILPVTYRKWLWTGLIAFLDVVCLLARNHYAVKMLLRKDTLRVQIYNGVYLVGFLVQVNASRMKKSLCSEVMYLFCCFLWWATISVELATFRSCSFFLSWRAIFASSRHRRGAEVQNSPPWFRNPKFLILIRLNSESMRWPTEEPKKELHYF